VIHCLDTPDSGNKYGIEQVEKWHKKRGFKDIATGLAVGYHAIIRRDGLIEYGRPTTSIGAHCRGYNRNSLGIALAGRSQFEVVQWDSLINLCVGWMRKFNIHPDNFDGHRELNKSKFCPGFDCEILRRLLNTY